MTLEHVPASHRRFLGAPLAGLGLLALGIGLSVSSAWADASVYQTFNNVTSGDPFSDGTPYYLGNNATGADLPYRNSSGGHLALQGDTTPPSNSKPYIVFDGTDDLASAKNVYVEFYYRLSNGSSTPADGFGLALIPSTALGGATGAPANVATALPANWERPAAANSFCVGFDIYNAAGATSGLANEISLSWNGTQQHTKNVATVNSTLQLKNEVWNRVRFSIRRNGSDSYVTLLLQKDSFGTPAEYTIYQDTKMTGMVLQPSRLAFGARTGGSWTLCDINDVKTKITDLYVSPTGDDTKSGSSTTPLRNLSTAVSRADDGGTVRLTAGTHLLGSSSTVGTVTVGKTLSIIGAGATGTGRTTLRGEWTDTVNDQLDYLNPMLSLNSGAAGSVIQGIEFVGGSAYNARRIGSGIYLNSAYYVDILNCNFLNIAGPAIEFWDGRYLEIRNSNFTDCGYEKNEAATGDNGGSVGGMIHGVTVKSCVMDELTFTHSTSTLGSGGYGIKLAGEMTDNVYSNITTNLKDLAAWIADTPPGQPPAGQAPCFAFETGGWSYPGGSWSPFYNNVIENCVFNNPISIGPGYYAGYPDATAKTYIVRNNTFNSPVEYNIEVNGPNMVFENNYSKRNSFLYNRGSPVFRMTVRKNVSENLRSAFVTVQGPSYGTVIYNNTAHFNNQTGYNSPYPVVNPVFASFEGNTSDGYRGIFNNLVVSTSTSTAEKFVAFGATTVTDYNNLFVQNNHVHDFPLPSSSVVPGLGNNPGELANNTSTTTSATFTFGGNLVNGGTLGTTNYLTFWEPRSTATQLVNKGRNPIPTNPEGAKGQTGGTFNTISYTGSAPDIGGVEYVP